MKRLMIIAAVIAALLVPSASAISQPLDLKAGPAPEFEKKKKKKKRQKRQHRWKISGGLATSFRLAEPCYIVPSPDPADPPTLVCPEWPQLPPPPVSASLSMP
ncbi:MAG TPA: hypothetical protein VKA41_06350 [Solirubrobacterales bacterium]|nr:hypothetical protein [Solirubrobacterales bacterium]